MSSHEVGNKAALQEEAYGQFAKGFFTRLIDYAGLFPPARLPLEAAIRNFHRYQGSPERWMLSRFVITTETFLALSEELIALFTSERPLPLSLIVGDPAKDLPEVFSRIDTSKGRVSLERIECRLEKGPDTLSTYHHHIDFLSKDSYAKALTAAFFELGAAGEGWEQGMEELVREMAVRNKSAQPWSGLKLRCGGIEDSFIPSPERVATVLATVAAHRVPIKFTAGLHHPFRHAPHKTEGNLTKPVHGFFNVFFAAFVACLQNEPASALVPLVSEMEDTAPIFDESSVSWLGCRLLYSDIERVRRDKVLSFGSCSFEEPIADATEVGWMKR